MEMLLDNAIINLSCKVEWLWSASIIFATLTNDLGLTAPVSKEDLAKEKKNIKSELVFTIEYQL